MAWHDRYYITSYYITVHYIMHYITLHCIALHCFALLYIVLYYITNHRVATLAPLRDTNRAEDTREMGRLTFDHDCTSPLPPSSTGDTRVFETVGSRKIADVAVT